MSLQKIISYVELGHSSHKGVRLTAAIAENHGASVEVVLTAPKRPLHTTSIIALAPPKIALALIDQTHQAVDRRLAESVEVLESETLIGGAITTHKLANHEVDTLIEHANATNADLIVMSRERTGLFDRTFHRSFAEKLARSSGCPVILVVGETEVTPPLRNILVAVDYSECSRRAAIAARYIVGNAGTLTFQHVMPIPPLFVTTKIAAEVELEKLQEWVSALRFTDVETKCYVSDGAPDYEIARVANEIAADIVVVGSRPHKNWTETVFGTVTDRLIEVCGRPVLAVPSVTAVTYERATGNSLSDSFPTP